MKTVNRAIVAVTMLALTATGALAKGAGEGCDGLPGASQLKAALAAAASSYGTIGGLFGGTRMWAAVVNRNGQLCAFATSTDDPAHVWPGSQAIAKAKAYTANAFSLDYTNGGFALSTAQLYTFVQGGHSLFGLNESNLFQSDFLAGPGGQGGGKNQIAGGIITFGGGVALYQGTTAVGGLGISGDTACADHEIARNSRDALGMNPPAGPGADDITYAAPSVFLHPFCLNTFHNGSSVINPKTGDNNETPAPGY